MSRNQRVRLLVPRLNLHGKWPVFPENKPGQSYFPLWQSRRRLAVKGRMPGIGRPEYEQGVRPILPGEYLIGC